jgi:DNA repair exonuclease SbcCD nuclease subunit
MFKYIHTADIHLDSPLCNLDYYEGLLVDEFRHATRQAFDNIVQLAMSEGVDFVLIAGDLYDGDWKDYNTGLYLISRMSQLDMAGIRVFIVAGNHDAASRITKTLRFPENVYTFKPDRPGTQYIEHLQVAIHGQSFSSPAIRKDLSQAFPNARDGYFNIGLLHTSANGREGHEPYAPCSVDSLKSKGYQYWALGHIHHREVLSHNPPVVFPGNPQGRHVRETGPKGCMLVTVDDNFGIQMDFRPVDVVRWAVADVAANDVDSGFELVDRCRLELKAIQDENEGMPLAVRCRVTGATSACDDIMADVERWTNEIRAAAIEVDRGRLWLEKVQFKLIRPFSNRLLKGSAGPVGELLDLLEELKDDPDMLNQLSAELLDVLKKLPRELKEGPGAIKLDDSDWLRVLLMEVQALLLTKLQHKGRGIENR